MIKNDTGKLNLIWENYILAIYTKFTVVALNINIQ